MKKSEIKMLEGLLDRQDVEGKKLIERLLWLNTTTPKYNVGDAVMFTCKSYRIYGVQVINFTGTIKKIDPDSRNKRYNYLVEFRSVTKNEDVTSTVCVLEDAIIKKIRKASDNIISPISQYREMIDL